MARPTRLARWKEAAQRLKREIQALYWAYQDPRTPWYARLLAVLIVAYALSPIDLIPDPIPVLGYLDDLLLLPLGIWLVLRWIPPEVMADAHRSVREEGGIGVGLGLVGAFFVVLFWSVSAYAVWTILNDRPR
jgi:uncharacterized membrane protein YkvA (DUF1232 family)